MTSLQLAETVTRFVGRLLLTGTTFADQARQALQPLVRIFGTLAALLAGMRG